jgi:hypothetical protein
MEMIPVSNKLPTTKQLKQQLQDYRDTAPALGDATPYLRLTRQGDWVYGPDGVPAGQGRFIIHPASFQHGYISWSDDDGPARVLGEVMVPFSEPDPGRDALPETGTSWDEQIAFMIAGVDSKVTLLYKTTSLGGRRANQRIIEAILSRDDSDSNTAPVVKLEVDSYRHKKYGEIFVPIFDIVGWADPTKLGVEDEPKKKAAPRRKRIKRVA